MSEHVAPPRREKRRRVDSALRPRSIWSSIPLSTAFARPAQFDFRTGLPDASLFPHAVWRRLMARELRSEPVGGGVYAHPAGHRGLREAIARHLGISRGVEASVDDITITNGTQQAIDVVARALLDPGDRVAVEDPGYAPPRLLFTSLGARVVGVPVDGEGLVVDAMPRHARLAYVTPSHQYPLGVPMTLSRLALLRWAEQHDAAIVEDDYDSEFRFGGRPIEPLQLLDTAGRVIYVGSFSKTMLPTLRLGFIVTPPSVRDAVHRAKFVTDWHTSLLAQATLARFIDDGGFARHLRKMNGVYRARVARSSRRPWLASSPTTSTSSRRPPACTSPRWPAPRPPTRSAPSFAWPRAPALRCRSYPGSRSMRRGGPGSSSDTGPSLRRASRKGCDGSGAASSTEPRPARRALAPHMILKTT